MDRELKLRCRCGQVRGVARVSPESGNHIVCYCDDCQAFAHHLERADVLDGAGGTLIYQMAPARLGISQGAAALRCLRLSPKGMVRWYTECCRTPVANTVAGRLPFVGLIGAFMDLESDGVNRDALLGKAALLGASFAVGDVPAHAHPRAPLSFLVRIVTRLFAWWVTGKGQPSPFVDAQYQPRTSPYVLTAEQRAALRPAARVSASTAPG